MKYRFYREHKYVSYAVSELERLIAKTDFRDAVQIDSVESELKNIEDLMTGHAEWEESSIHELLRKKNSAIHQLIENDHKDHAEQFRKMRAMLVSISNCTEEQDQLDQGYQFYLAYRQFAGNNLKHLHDEETILMAELQKFYSDEELRAVEFKTYAKMTPDEMIGMMRVLFPHMNPSDQEFFKKEMHDAEPEKFAIAWKDMHEPT